MLERQHLQREKEKWEKLALQWEQEKNENQKERAEHARIQGELQASVGRLTEELVQLREEYDKLKTTAAHSDAFHPVGALSHEPEQFPNVSAIDVSDPPTDAVQTGQRSMCTHALED